MRHIELIKFLFFHDTLNDFRFVFVLGVKL